MSLEKAITKEATVHYSFHIARAAFMSLRYLGHPPVSTTLAWEIEDEQEKIARESLPLIEKIPAEGLVLDPVKIIDAIARRVLQTTPKVPNSAVLKTLGYPYFTLTHHVDPENSNNNLSQVLTHYEASVEKFAQRPEWQGQGIVIIGGRYLTMNLQTRPLGPATFQDIPGNRLTRSMPENEKIVAVRALNFLGLL